VNEQTPIALEQSSTWEGPPAAMTISATALEYRCGSQGIGSRPEMPIGWRCCQAARDTTQLALFLAERTRAPVREAS
jgi:hypothetical protein